MQTFIEQSKSYLNHLEYHHRFINYDHKINELKELNNNLKIEIEEMNIKLLRLQKANRKNKESAHNVLSRFLADEMS